MITGSWTVRLTNQEVTRINQLLAAVSLPQDADVISVGSGPFPVGGGTDVLTVNGSDLFRNGVIVDGEGFHVFSADIQVLYDYIVELMVGYGVEVEHSAST